MNEPRWTVDDDPIFGLMLQWPGCGDRLEQDDLPFPAPIATAAHNALVQCVRDADTLHKARELANRLRRMRDEVRPEIGDLLDLLGPPVAGDPHHNPKD